MNLDSNMQLDDIEMDLESKHCCIAFCVICPWVKKDYNRIIH